MSSVETFLLMVLKNVVTYIGIMAGTLVVFLLIMLMVALLAD